MIRAYVQLTDRISRLFAVVSVLLLISAVLIICQMIFLRYFFREPTIWQTDFVIYAATASIFLGAPYVLMTRGHVGVDVVENLLRGTAKAALQIVAKLLGFIFCAVMFAASVFYVWEAWSLGWQTSNVWQIPVWIPAAPMPVGFGLLCLQYVAEFIRGDEETSR